MTLSEIMVEVLLIVHPVGSGEMDPSLIGEYLNDEAYRDFIIRIPGATERALADMALKRILPGNFLPGSILPGTGAGETGADEWHEPDGLAQVKRLSLEGRDEDIGIQETLARLIPYYVVSELYQHEEPGLASYYRNLYERGTELAGQFAPGGRRQSRVVPVFGVAEEKEWI